MVILWGTRNQESFKALTWSLKLISPNKHNETAVTLIESENECYPGGGPKTDSYNVHFFKTTCTTKFWTRCISQKEVFWHNLTLRRETPCGSQAYPGTPLSAPVLAILLHRIPFWYSYMLLVRHKLKQAHIVRP